MDQELFNKALLFALKAHNGVTRKATTTPFILHPLEVATIVASMTSSQETMAAALLHDTVEDADITLEEIREEFGDKVALLVASETENKRRDILPEESWQIRKAESLDLLHYTDSHDVRILWLADKLSNMRSFHRMYVEKGNAMWVDFHQQDPEKQGWYYRKVLEYTAELAHTTAYQEYRFLINKVFGEVKHGDD
ncbi:MAG: bifunctional (p)ppGpp synthetase/guanosine-3',5'-bis(diphosphate) 3'-pyrophosphohydrolase [Erysipelotrichaceae bacterium]|nr:bifunctional (p)ppGpp synthetase/guanosine-3',5'-bis(diphosphate) 3'-pyrophosphohydrolase [Erysipelotrichaceae bacterium]